MVEVPPYLHELEEKLFALTAEAQAMTVSELDGFIAGLLVSPELILPSEWLPLVWGIGFEVAQPVFGTKADLQSVVRLIMRHYNEVATELVRGLGRYGPIFEVSGRGEHQETNWEIWIEGFHAAVSLRPGSWAAMLDMEQDTEVTAALSMLAALVEIAHGDSELPQVEVDELIELAPEIIPELVEAFNARRLQQGAAASPSQRAGPKVGRNEPCPCGSGQKYKKCCGLN